MMAMFFNTFILFCSSNFCINVLCVKPCLTTNKVASHMGDIIYASVTGFTSPVNPVTDAYIISPMCDATLFVVRHGLTHRTFIQKLDEQNNMKVLKNMAIIFNGIKQRGFAAYGYGSYGYG